MIGLWMVLVACGGSVEKSEHAAGAAKHPHFPFPSMHHMADGRVALPEDLPREREDLCDPLPEDRCEADPERDL